MTDQIRRRYLCTRDALLRARDGRFYQWRAGSEYVLPEALAEQAGVFELPEQLGQSMERAH